MLEIIAKIGLFFNQPALMIAIIFVGFICLNEKIYGRILFLLLFTTIYNVFLKSLFQVPLPQPLEGWAFPSGHMHSAVVFWGSLALAYRKLWVFAVVTLILSLNGYGLVYSIYHYPIDIVGALGFGGLSLLITYYLQKQPFFDTKPYRLGFLFSLLAIIVIFFIPEQARKVGIWQGLGGLIGFTLGWFYLSQKQTLSLKGLKTILPLILTIAGASLLYVLIQTLPLTVPLTMGLQCFCIGLWLNISKLILSQRALRFGLLD